AHVGGADIAAELLAAAGENSRRATHAETAAQFVLAGHRVLAAGVRARHDAVELGFGHGTLGITFTPDGAHGVGHRRAHAAARERQVVDGDAQVVVTTHLLVHALAIAAGGIGEDEYFGFLIFGREGDHVGLVQRLDARLAHTFELLLAEVDHAADGDGLEHVPGEDVAAVERAVQALDAIDFHFHQRRYRGFLDLGHGGAIE